MRNAVYQSMLVELEGSETKRANVKLSKEDKKLVFDINAMDFVSLRAISNSMLRLLDTSLRIAEQI